jgi:cytoskeletal protein RodZ
MKIFILVAMLILAIYSLKYTNANSHSRTISTHYGNPDILGPLKPSETPNITSTQPTNDTAKPANSTNDTTKPADTANSTDGKPTDS